MAENFPKLITDIKAWSPVAPRTTNRIKQNRIITERIILEFKNTKKENTWEEVKPGAHGGVRKLPIQGKKG